MSNVTFTDPRLGTTYEWENNPIADNEQPGVKVRNIERTSNTANVGAVKQQGDDGPLILDWTVNVFSDAMQQQLWTWYMLCKTQTIYVTDWDGEQYEGQIIYMSRKRQVASEQYTTYQIMFEVYGLLSGILHSAGVTP